jgi:hypothetical protein
MACRSENHFFAKGSIGGKMQKIDLGSKSESMAHSWNFVVCVDLIDHQVISPQPSACCSAPGSERSAWRWQG